MSSPRPLPWQHTEWGRLCRALSEGRLHHGLLIAGPAGIGKRQLAEALVGLLLCDAPADGAACGRCRGCTLLSAGSHPDLHAVGLEEDARQLRIDQMRALAEFASRTASIAARKVITIDPADAMTVSAANALLKSLEEPVAGTHLLLLSDVPARLPATIRSRCEQLRLPLPPRGQALDWLRCEGEESAEELLTLASGRPLAARAMGRNAALTRFDAAVEVLLRASRADAPIAQLAAASDEMGLPEWLGWISLFLLDLARYLAGAGEGGGGLLLQRAAHARATLGKLATPPHVARIQWLVLERQRELAAGANPNRLLSIESVLHEWQRGCARAQPAG